MSLFQPQILTKYLALQDRSALQTAFEQFSAHFHNPQIQENIRNAKEEQYQGEFLIDLFANVLGYVKHPAPNFNLTTELKNLKDGKKADGAILKNGEALAVIELKGMDTTDLGKVEYQAFSYKNNHPTCHYVIISNFQKLRFYIDNAVEFLEFDLFSLDCEQFATLYLLLNPQNLLNDLPAKLKSESLGQEDAITKQLYQDYSAFKRQLFQNLLQKNPQFEPLVLFKKSQKLLDRFLFLFFGEDRGLLPPNSVRTVLDQWQQLKELDEDIPLYNRFKKYFGYLNTGFKGKKYDVFAYNGGLFKPDEILDSIEIDDEVLFQYASKLADYDFASEIDVNILGHIFENSLNELDEITAELNGEKLEKNQTKRKKDGVFYTPKYITQYIVQNTVGKLCEAKKTEFEIVESDYTTEKKRNKSFQTDRLQRLENYRNWLLEITICDPACGSGAFLNEALNFLLTEHAYIDELESKLFGSALAIPNVQNHILENNLYGVDINSESVDIAKLSLWLRTAEPNRKLSSLNENLKCGNSLIDDPNVAGDLAFNWQQAFPKVFQEKQKRAFHISTAVHDSRTSQRMLDYKVRELRHNKSQPQANVIPFSHEEEIIVSRVIADIAKEKNLHILAYNICVDHLHIVLVCEESEISQIMQLIKGRTSHIINKHRRSKGLQPLVQTSVNETDDKGLKPLATGEQNTPVWTQKFGLVGIDDDEQLQNTINYVNHNRLKHEIEDDEAFSVALNAIIAEMVCSYDEAFKPEYKGGFDVVIGNPPYGATLNEQQKLFIQDNYQSFEYQVNTYVIFYELGLNLLKENGLLGFITPATFTYGHYFKKIREIFQQYQHICISKYFYEVFADADIGDAVTWIIQKSKNEKEKSILVQLCDDIEQSLKPAISKSYDEIVNLDFTYNLSLCSLSINSFIEGFVSLGDISNIIVGIKPYQTGKGKPAQTQQIVKDKIYTAFVQKPDDSYTKCIIGKDFHRYIFLNDPNMYIQYGEWLAEPRFTAPFFDDEKIVIRQTSDSLICHLDCTKSVNLNNVYNVGKLSDHFELKYILCLLNSKLMNKLYQSISQEKGRLFAEVKKIYLEKLPIKSIPLPEQQPFIDQADKMLEKNAKLQTLTAKFLRSLERELGLNEPSKALQNWYGLDFATFLKELSKKKVKLSLSQKAEWEDYFLTEQQKAVTLQNEIAETDKTIDQMVYQLYGLSDDEIAMIV